jgi:hypothetical protein
LSFVDRQSFNAVPSFTIRGFAHKFPFFTLHKKIIQVHHGNADYLIELQACSRGNKARVVLNKGRNQYTKQPLTSKILAARLVTAISLMEFP